MADPSPSGVAGVGAEGNSASTPSVVPAQSVASTESPVPAPMSEAVTVSMDSPTPPVTTPPAPTQPPVSTPDTATMTRKDIFDLVNSIVQSITGSGSAPSWTPEYLDSIATKALAIIAIYHPGLRVGDWEPAIMAGAGMIVVIETAIRRWLKKKTLPNGG